MWDYSTIKMPHPTWNEGGSQVAPKDLNDELSTYPLHYMWVRENKEKILDMHSSPTQTSIFCKECFYCDRWFKHCMFSNAERKADEACCRWCQTENGQTTASQFEIHRHIHCNRPGQNICGKNCTMVPAAEVHVKEASINDVAPPKEQFVVKKKMSQKERKAAQRAAASNWGL